VHASHHVVGSSRPASRAAASLISAAAIVLAATALGAFVPATSAAPRSTSAASPIVVPGSATALSGASLQALLASVHLGASTPTVPAVPLDELEAPKLAQLLAGLTPINQLTGLPLPGLPPSTLGAAGLKASLQQGIENAVAAGDTLGQVLSAKGLSPYLSQSLTTALGAAVEPVVAVLLKKSVEEALAEGLATTSVTALTHALLNEAAHPITLAEALVGSFDAATVQTRTGSLPAAAPVQSLTLEELATQLSLTPQALADQLAQPTLPGSTPVTLSPLEGGHELALLSGVGGLTAVLLTKATELPESLEETAAGLPGGAKGGSGGGGAGGGGGTTVVNNASSGGSTTIVAGPPATAPPSAAAPSNAGTTPGRLKLVGHRVKGTVVTLVLQVPAAGRLHVGSSGMRSITRTVRKAARVTVRIALTKARAAQLRRHHPRTLKVTLRASFLALGGAKSSVVTRVVLR
jgi:hypothetical protein